MDTNNEISHHNHYSKRLYSEFLYREKFVFSQYNSTKKLAHISQIYYFCKVEFHSTYTMVTKCLI